MHIIIIFKYKKVSDEKQPRKSGDTVFAIITLSVAMETSSLIWPHFKLIQALMYVIITCKYEKDPAKNNRENATMPFSKFYHYLMLWKPMVWSGRISISSKLLCMSSLTASMKGSDEN